MKLFNKHITDLKYTILYDNMCKNIKFVYKKKYLTNKNKNIIINADFYMMMI